MEIQTTNVITYPGTNLQNLIDAYLLLFHVHGIKNVPVVNNILYNNGCELNELVSNPLEHYQTLLTKQFIEFNGSLTILKAMYRVVAYVDMILSEGILFIKIACFL